MNRNHMLIAAALATVLGTVGTAAQAYEGEGNGVQTIVSTKSRADVQAEALQARQGVNTYAYGYNPLAGFKSTRNAADVRAEFIAHRAQVQAMNSEDSGSAWLAAHGPVDSESATTVAGQPINTAY